MLDLLLFLPTAAKIESLSMIAAKAEMTILPSSPSLINEARFTPASLFPFFWYLFVSRQRCLVEPPQKTITGSFGILLGAVRKSSTLL